MGAVPILEEARRGLHISASAVGTLHDCPRKFYYYYIEGAPEEDVAASLVLGRAIHQALAFYYRHLRDESETPGLRELLSVAGSAIVKAVASKPPILFREGEDASTLVEQARDLLAAFLENGYRPVRVLGVELPFRLRLVHPRTGEQLPYEERVVGAMDLVAQVENGEITVIDHKTASRSDRQKAQRTDVQMSVYSVAAREHFGVEQVGLRYQQLVKTKTPRVEHTKIQRADGDETAGMEAVASALELVHVAVSHPRGKLLMGRHRSWKCRDCSYRRRCEGDRW